MFIVQEGRANGSSPNEVVSQDRCPQFAMYYVWRLAANATEVQFGPDTSDFQFRFSIPISSEIRGP